MAREFQARNLITWVVEIIVMIYLASPTKAQTGPYHLLMFALKWPPSYCNSIARPCQGPILADFTIHGLWPMYNLTQSHSLLKTIDMVPPYNDTGCNDIPPMSSENITYQLLHLIINDLTTYWPDVENPESQNSNENVWQYQWKKHGMCFDTPDTPLHYFTTAVDLAKQFDLLDTLLTRGIVPSNTYGYSIQEISRALWFVLGKRATIFCNEVEEGNGRKSKQLAEIRTCLEKGGIVLSNRYGYSLKEISKALWEALTDTNNGGSLRLRGSTPDLSQGSEAGLEPLTSLREARATTITPLGYFNCGPGTNHTIEFPIPS
ncbi:ribonuclease 1-like [Tripterygium wilfordii]|uniref:ribonuclease 1-like n=1 Tax=Tripterygium wilfordii TaxID=458696 RepID=UPI0018F8597F|nr:ribonuclease 1-like [Tripterygium wilfordii]